MWQKTIKLLEDSKVIELYESGISIKDVAKKVGVESRTISQYLKNNNIEIRKSNTIYDFDKAKELYESGKNIQEVSEIMNISCKTLSKHFKTAGIKILRNGVKDTIDYNIFDSIDTEEKAYWLGFLYADGNIASGRPKISVNLSIKDENHLRKFMKFLNYTYDMRYQHLSNGDLCRMSFDSSHMTNTLISYGCVPKKSLIVKFPNTNIFKDSSLIKDFIRGYFDGDGCVTYKNSKHTIPEITIVGTKDMLDNFSKYFNLGHQHIRLHHPETGNLDTYVLIATDRKAWNCLEYLYKDATIYLDRKFDRYLEFRPLYDESYIESSKIGELCDENTEVSSEIA